MYCQISLINWNKVNGYLPGEATVLYFPPFSVGQLLKATLKEIFSQTDLSSKTYVFEDKMTMFVSLTSYLFLCRISSTRTIVSFERDIMSKSYIIQKSKQEFLQVNLT